MPRTVGLPVAIVLALVVAAAAPAAGLGAPIDDAGAGLATSQHAALAQNETTPVGNTSLAPGAMLSGVVGVQAAEFEGELEGRAFGERIARSASNQSKAAVVAAQVHLTRERLESLREDRDRLQTAYENGSISEDQYKARLASIAARIRAAERLTNRTEATARGLPAEALRANDVDVAAIEELRRNASGMTGPAVAAIAREIAGNDPGVGLAGDRAPNATGPPGEVGPGGDQAGPPAGGDQDRGPGNRSEPPGAGSNDPGPPNDSPPGRSG